MGQSQVGMPVWYRQRYCDRLHQLLCFCGTASVCSCLGSVQNPQFPTLWRAERRKMLGVARTAQGSPLILELLQRLCQP